MAKYIDGFIVPVTKSGLEAYKQIAEITGQMWKEHGALNYLEGVADDLHGGHETSFPKSVDLKADEIVVLAFITFKDRKHRDQVNEKVMADPRMKKIAEEGGPFDCKRMIWGASVDLLNTDLLSVSNFTHRLFLPRKANCK